MLLHVIAAGVFLPKLHALFEAADPGEHVYVARVRSGETPDIPDYARRIDDVAEIRAALESRHDIEGVTVNGLSCSEMERVAEMVPDDMNIAWFVWGHEAYAASPRLTRRLYQRETRALVPKTHVPFVRRVKRAARRGLDVMTGAAIPPFDRFDYFVGQLPSEYALYRRAGLFSHTEYHWGAVGSLEDYVNVDAPLAAPGPDIQLGNAATPTMNHLDALSLLASVDFGDRRVIAPLSYGYPEYRDAVFEAGRERLGSKFVALTDFLPLDEYLRITQRCGIVVMNQERQQAIGNVLAAIWRGAVVYLNDTPLFRDYAALDLPVRLIGRDLRNDAAEGFPPLTLTEIERHRHRLAEYLGRDVVVREIRDLVGRLRSDVREGV